MDGTIGAQEAKARLATLLDRVERGESLTITRDGRPVARLVPARPEGAPARGAAEGLRSLREDLRAAGVQPFTPEEIVGLVRDGRNH